jgi:hypothetical protein
VGGVCHAKAVTCRKVANLPWLWIRAESCRGREGLSRLASPRIFGRMNRRTDGRGECRENDLVVYSCPSPRPCCCGGSYALPCMHSVLRVCEGTTLTIADWRLNAFSSLDEGHLLVCRSAVGAPYPLMGTALSVRACGRTSGSSAAPADEQSCLPLPPRREFVRTCPDTRASVAAASYALSVKCKYRR